MLRRLFAICGILLFLFSVGTFAATWRSNPDMTWERVWHTMTLLPNGKILIVGGGGTDPYSAELYDPATGQFTLTGSMTDPRYDHTATLLPNGKVLVAGGRYYGSILSSALLYDPDTETFSPTGAMISTRRSHTATLLPNGNVLISGGRDDGGAGFLSSAEVYVTSTGTFAATGSMVCSREYQTATLLPNGDVLIAGGTGDQTNGMSSAEVYDHSLGTFHSVSDMTIARWDHAATLLPNGKILITGGKYTFAGLSSAEVYDPGTETFSPVASMANLRSDHTSTLLPSGKVLVAGGGPIGTELYDPISETFDSAGDMYSPYPGAAAILLPNGKVLITGGLSGDVYKTTMLYDPFNGTFEAVSSMNAARYLFTATLLPNGKVLIAGGVNDMDGYLSSELYDPANDSFTSIGPMQNNRCHHSATLLANGKVLIAGGRNNSDLTSAELFDYTDNSFSPTGSMAHARYQHTATLLANGTVLMAGGQGPTALAEVYYPSTGQFVSTGSMTTARQYHTATLLTDGKVLITGGNNGSSCLSSAELYDPSTKAFSFTANNMNAARNEHTATLLTDGKVLITGGNSDGSYLSSAELYNPADGSFTLTTGTMSDVRDDHTATLLPNGKVLIAGGSIDGDSNCVKTVDLYDPSSGLFEAANPMVASDGREHHTATLLPNGKVLIAGGRAGAQKLDSAELGRYTEYDYTSFESMQPVIVSFPAQIEPGGGPYTITGAGFKGTSEASGGNGSANSPTNYPRVYLQKMNTGNMGTMSEGGMLLDCSASVYDHPISETSIQFTAPSNLPGGYYLLTVVVNAVPSTAEVVYYEPPAVYPPAPAPEGLVTTNITTTSADGTWETVGGATSYVLSWGTDTNATNEGEIATTEASYSWTGLSLSTVYYWKVAAVTGGVTGEYSDIAFFETLSSGPVSVPDLIWAKLNGKTLRPTIFNYTSASPEVEIYVTSESGMATMDANVSTGLLGIYQTIYFELIDGTTFEGTWRGTDRLAMTSKGDYAISFRGTDSKGESYGMPPISALEAYQLRIRGGRVQMIGEIYNYPNPFKPSSGGTTQIQYTLSGNASIFLIIYDMTGHEVKRMKFAAGGNGGSAGVNYVPWDGTSLNGRPVGIGMYLYKIISGDRVLGDGRIVVLD